MNRGILALVIIVALIVAVVAIGSGGGSAPSNNAPPGTSKPNSDPPLKVVRPARVTIECERPERLEDQAPNGTVVMKREKVMMGEEIGYLEIPDGWIKECNLESTKGQPGALPGKAFYRFELPRDDTYFVFLRAKWHDSCGNSVYLRCDESPYDAVEDTMGSIDEANYRWAWHPVMRMGEIKALALKAGTHTLELNTKEDGPQFDKILVTTEASAPVD